MSEYAYQTDGPNYDTEVQLQALVELARIKGRSRREILLELEEERDDD